MKGYLKYFKTQIIFNLQYKTAAFAGVFTQAFWGFMYIFIYQAFYSSGINNVPINYKELVTYLWLNQSFLMLIYLRFNDSEIIDSIKSGGIAYELCRPYNLYFWWYVKLIAKKLALTFLRCLPILLLAFLLPVPYNLNLPCSLISLIFFIITLILGLLLVCSIHMLVYVISFYTYNDSGIKSIILVIAELLSGVAVPVPLLPDILKKITYFLPFRLIGDLPFRIYSGNISVKDILPNISLQILWIIILIFFGNLLIKNTLKKVFIQGG